MRTVFSLFSHKSKKFSLEIQFITWFIRFSFCKRRIPWTETIEMNLFLENWFFFFLFILFFLHHLDSSSSTTFLPSDELFQHYPAGLLHFATAACIVFILVGIPGNLITIIALARCKKVSSIHEKWNASIFSFFLAIC